MYEAPKIKVEPLESGEGFYWAFYVEGELYADGEESTREEAQESAEVYKKEWEDRNDPE